MTTETKQVTYASIYSLDGSELTTGLQTGAVCDEAIKTAWALAEEKGQAVHLVDHDGEWLVGAGADGSEIERYSEKRAAYLLAGI